MKRFQKRDQDVTERHGTKMMKGVRVNKRKRDGREREREKKTNEIVDKNAIELNLIWILSR